MTSRKISFCVSRSIFMPVACSVASTPDMRLLNSATRSSCSRRLRSMHLRGRHAEARAAHLLFPLELRRLVMDAWVPDEVKVQRCAAGNSPLRFSSARRRTVRGRLPAKLHWDCVVRGCSVRSDRQLLRQSQIALAIAWIVPARSGSGPQAPASSGSAPHRSRSRSECRSPYIRQRMNR